MYVATKYIGNDFTPGEVLPADLDGALVKRLLKLGAIREIAHDHALQNADNMTEEEKVEALRNNYVQQLRALGYAPDGIKPDNDNQSDDEGGDDTDGEDGATDEPQEEQEPEAPEIDVAAALVQEEKKSKISIAKKGASRDESHH